MTIKAAVIGWPIQHTKSPLIHTHWLEKYGIDGRYDAIAIPAEDLKARIRQLVDDGYAGFNVTVPHKQVIMQYLDFIRADAERIGAVNTVVIGPDGKLEGRNTDFFGFTGNLKDAAPDFDMTAGPVTVLGAGGAARAVVYALVNAGVKDIRIVNRTYPRAKELAASFPPAKAKFWEEIPDLLKDTALLVNTTTLGMTGQLPLEIDLSPLPKTALVHDIVYNPLETELLQQARRRNLKTIPGIGMLLHQARPAFQAWFGVMPDVDDGLTKKVLG